MRFFTAQERFTILFLIFLFVLSTSLYLYKLNHPLFAPAYLIEDFDERIKEREQPSAVIDYNLPLPEKENPPGFRKTPLSEKSVNINKANESELMKLPGIGPVYAQRIVAYREKNGRFNSTEEIKNVSGIGEKTFLKMKNYLTTE
jgi:competence ComEA-like helix-hairpin-helix protein